MRFRWFCIGWISANTVAGIVYYFTREVEEYGPFDAFGKC